MSSTEESIEVMHRPSVQSSELADLRKALMAFSPNVDFREHDPGPQANVDWALPAALAIYVSAPLVRSFLSTLGSKAAEATIGAFSSAHRRINGRSKWLQAGGRVRRGPVISVALADALLDQHADVAFIFPTTMTQKEFRYAMSRLPAVVRRERRRVKRYFERPGSAHAERTVRFYYQRDSSRWKRVWPYWTDWDEHSRTGR